jgi:tripartite-type tricarboxylate transporter receptor subunit TctC
MTRRIRILAVLGCITLGAASAQAQDYPSKPITIVVPFQAGGATDVIARAVAQRLSQGWGRSIVIENKAGASTQIGAAYVARSAPDGYTLLVGPDGTFVINPYLYRKLPYDPDRDFAPISGLGFINQALVVHPSTPVRNVADLISLAKAQRGDLNYASFGVSSAGHLSMELLQARTGVKLNAVQYKGSIAALTDVIAGHPDDVHKRGEHGAALESGPSQSHWNWEQRAPRRVPRTADHCRDPARLQRDVLVWALCTGRHADKYHSKDKCCCAKLLC